MSRGFCWFEHLSASPERATEFYRAVFGWLVTDIRGYRRFVEGGRPVGGVRELPAPARARGAPAHWLGHVAGASVDADVADAVGRGGLALGGVQRVEGLGAFALVRDPQGAVLALSATEQASLGAVGASELACRSNEDAWTFYQPMLQAEERGTWELGEELGAYVLFEDGLGGRGGLSNAARLPGVHCHWAYYFDRPDAQDACARVERAGGRVVQGPFETPAGDFVAYCEDNQGAAFGIREPASSDDASAGR